MSFEAFFFPIQSQALHLKQIAEQRRRTKRRRRARLRDADSMNKRVEELEADLGYVSLLLCSVMAQLDERGHLSRGDLRELIKDVDGADGEEDGRLDIDVLRELIE